MTKRICDVVVIDTMAAVTPGGNENSSEDVGKLLEHCKFIHRKTGAIVILIHHSGKDATKGARGWSGLRAAADTEIEVVRNGDHRSFRVSKQKDGEEHGPMGFRLVPVRLGVDADGEEESSCVVEHVEQAPEEARTGKQKPSGRHQLLMYDVLKTVAPSGTVALEDLVAGYTAKVPKGTEGRDNRKRDAKRALEELIAKKLAYMHGDDRVSLTSLITTGNEGWLE